MFSSTHHYRRHSQLSRIARVLFHHKLTVIIVLALFGAAYIAEANLLSSHGIKIKALKRDINESRRSYEQLEIQVASNQSMSALESRIKSFEFVPTTNEEYITVPSGAVALR